MSDFTSLSALSLVELIRAREISPVQVAKSFLARIERLNPALNAIVTLSPKLIDDARKAETALMRGEQIGPLHGVPFTVKDTIDTDSLRTTSGSAMRADHIPDKDAPAVSRMRAEGAILLGKKNTAEMAMDYTEDNPVFGSTNNTHDHTRTHGVSGCGVACMFELG